MNFIKINNSTLEFDVVKTKLGDFCDIKFCLVALNRFIRTEQLTIDPEYLKFIIIEI